MFESLFVIAAIVSLILLYRFLPNRRIFAYFCVVLLAVFIIAAFISQNRNNQKIIDESMRYALIEQQKIFTAWYSQYQKDIEQLDRNWQLYHSIVDNINAEDIDIAMLHERLSELEIEAKKEQVNVYTLKPPPGLGAECEMAVEQLIRKTQIYADAQIQTISLSVNAINPELLQNDDLQTEDIESLIKSLQDIMIRNSPIGLFTANELSIILNYFDIDE